MVFKYLLLRLTNFSLIRSIRNSYHLPFKLLLLMNICIYKNDMYAMIHLLPFKDHVFFI